jgi:hypothetical protein
MVSSGSAKTIWGVSAYVVDAPRDDRRPVSLLRGRRRVDLGGGSRRSWRPFNRTSTPTDVPTPSVHARETPPRRSHEIACRPLSGRRSSVKVDELLIGRNDLCTKVAT